MENFSGSGYVLAETILLLALMYGGIRFTRGFRNDLKKRSVLLAAACAGFAGLALETSLILIYQSAHGYVFTRIGLMFASFMFGSACGAVFARKSAGEEPGIIASCLALSVLMLLLPLFAWNMQPIVYHLFLLAGGALTGMVFSIVLKLLPQRAGEIYAADLFGACAGGAVTGGLLVPVAGFAATCAATAALCFLGTVPLAVSLGKRNHGKNV